MHVCTKKYLFCFKNHLMRLQFSCNYAMFFSVRCFSGGTCRTNKIKFLYVASACCCDLLSVELTNSSATQNHLIFQPTSEQAKYGVSGTFKKKSKGFCSFSLRLEISGFFVEWKLCFDCFNTVYCILIEIRNKFFDLIG